MKTDIEKVSKTKRKIIIPISILTIIICALALALPLSFIVRGQSNKGERNLKLETKKSPGEKRFAALPGGAKRFALVIGVDKYQDKQITTLGGASNDAKSIADALVRYAAFPSDQVILLASDQPDERQPTRGNILRRLSNLRNNVPKDGLLLVSFAGHGMEREGKAYLLPSDAQVSGDIALLEDTAINVEVMRDRIRQTGVEQVIMLLDACRNDPAGRSDTPNNLTEAYTRGFNFDLRNKDIKAFATLYATDIGMRAYEYTERKQGYFTWAIVEGLKGGAANQKGEVTLEGLKKYVEDTVAKRVSIDLGASKQQRPRAVIDGYKADELVISIKVNPGSNAIELEFWNTIKSSTNPEDFKEYLKKYPDGEFSGLARNRLATLETAAGTGSGPAKPVEPAAAAGRGPRSFEFETLILSIDGDVLKRYKKQANYFVEDISGVPLEMVELQGGSFLMGSASDSGVYHDNNEEPQHQVNLPPFAIGKFEVTQAQWQAVAKLPKVNIDLKPDPSRFKFEDSPVERVSWEEAMEFCARLSKLTGKTYRLPTESEWEYACRAGSTAEFSFGQWITHKIVNFRGVYRPQQREPEGVKSQTVPVGSLGVPNAFGVFDMHGNVWEYCLDGWHENYSGAPVDGSAWENGRGTGFGVIRGGSYKCSSDPCRSAYRSKVPVQFKPDDYSPDYGFRVVMGRPQ
jgi:formylglycine-generating enzyme required for sulfatase activity